MDGVENPALSYDEEKFNGATIIPVDADETKEEKAKRKLERNKVFFHADNSKRIDYVLAYEEPGEEDKKAEEKITKRETYIQNLKLEGICIEEEDKVDSCDEKTCFVKLSVEVDALMRIAELMYLPKKLEMDKHAQDDATVGCCDCCCEGPMTVGEPYIPDEGDYFTSDFVEEDLKMFAIENGDVANFFTNSERSIVCKEILDRTNYDETKFGINRLIQQGVFKAAYPIHECPTVIPKIGKQKKKAFWSGRDMDRARLYETWARPGRWYCYQPLDLIRKYFGEKIGIYFAWLGFYTSMLIPAALAGTGVFIYGIVSQFVYDNNRASKEICEASLMGNTTMCPQCHVLCDYTQLKDSCLFSQISYLFDNWGTVVFAFFMSIWATVFLEFWKRTQKSIEYDWDVAQFELEERVRPEFEIRVTQTKRNPVTMEDEPYMGVCSRYTRQCTTFVVILFMCTLVIGAIVSVVVYRMVAVYTFYMLLSDNSGITTNKETYARLATSITGSVINFIAIIILNFIYQRIAKALTDLENPRTWTEYEDSISFKMFIFQFLNFYGTIFYIAFFKGKLSGVPNDKTYNLMGKYSTDSCDPSGCTVDLFIQLSIIMILKQGLNNAKELLLPAIISCWRTRKSKKGESAENKYMRWEEDLDLAELPPLGLFEEYLEMVIQFGFVTIFVAGFPLAPLFALINNVIEIRLDAYKFTSLWRRPPADKAQDIGVWFGILNSIAFISVVTNAFIIAFTSDFIPKLYYLMQNDGNLEGYINNTLAVFSVADYALVEGSGPDEGTLAQSVFEGTTCRYRGYYEPPDSKTPYEYTSDYWILFTARLAFIIVFEHVVFIATFLVSALIPDVPDSVKRLQVYERELIKKLRFDAANKKKSH